MYRSTPWYNTDLYQLETIPHTNPYPHRPTDPLVIAVDEVRLVYSTNVAAQRYALVVLLHIYRIRTPIIYNFATSQFVDLAI